ncbi:ac18-like protein [Peridroma alphabaculovirus]|uniref:Ac18-like protein n=1 Tax=Peridroma alphabaculovirus TaxID=1346829 RepID=A0A068LKK9_9ABAC|nr:ac18-like protein [Peridroma alphabaculovirus]AIE47837.1 ac18-like protein [Peridroma alphabaculovirus]
MMESLLQRLFNHRTIPYISKKYVNDELSDRVMRRFSARFYETVLREATRALDTLCVLKGGAAVAAHMQQTAPQLCDIDMEVYVDDERATVDNLNSFVALRKLETALRSVCEQHYDDIDARLAAVDINCLMNNNYSRSNMIIFKSYVSEAVEVEPDRVSFALNRNMPFKTTVSLVNDDYFLVRYSFNVHMTSASPMWLYRSDNRVQALQYFPFDVYFLDLTVKRAPTSFTDTYRLAQLYGLDVYVEDLKYLIADQLECLMFNVFNYHWHKIESRTQRLRALLELAPSDIEQATDEELERYRQLKRSDERFTLRDVKRLLYALGPLGPKLLIELYFMNRYDNSIKSVTHQVNFPYHRWERNYYSKCWKRFLDIVNSVFALGFVVQKNNSLE